jgi:hypothetical protein
MGTANYSKDTEGEGREEAQKLYQWQAGQGVAERCRGLTAAGTV